MTGSIEAVVAVSENDVIGRDNALPWHLPADLRHFKLLTTGRPVLMGRKTHESIGRALPNRTNIILSRRTGFSARDCIVVGSVTAARDLAGENTLMVIGGAEVYRQCIPFVSRIHLTLVHTRIERGEAFFDQWHGDEWRESHRERVEADARNAYAYSFVTLDRNR